jgi:hypothetical protein
MSISSNQRNKRAVFIWRISASHTVAYFIAVLFALSFMNFSQDFGVKTRSNLMLPIDHWQLAISLGLQPFRGIIIALVLWPFRETILKKQGWIKLAFLILGLSYFVTIAPAIGSFEGYIFTSVSIKYHLSGIPETGIYIFIFTSLLNIWYQNASRGMNFTMGIFVGFILLMSLFGVMDRLGLINKK